MWTGSITYAVFIDWWWIAASCMFGRWGRKSTVSLSMKVSKKSWREVKYVPARDMVALGAWGTFALVFWYGDFGKKRLACHQSELSGHGINNGTSNLTLRLNHLSPRKIGWCFCTVINKHLRVTWTQGNKHVCHSSGRTCVTKMAEDPFPRGAEEECEKGLGFSA